MAATQIPKHDFDSSGRFDLLRGEYWYAEGVDQLRRSGKEPLTFLQSYLARLANRELFKTDLDTCSGIVYPAGFPYQDPRFKVIPRSERLIDIPQDFDQIALQIPDFDSYPGHL